MSRKSGKSFMSAMADLGWASIDRQAKAIAQQRKADMRILAAKQAEERAMLAELRAEQIKAQTEGIIARRIRSQIGQDIDRNRKAMQYTQIDAQELKNEMLRLKIQELRRELGYRDDADTFTPNNYGF